MNSILFHIGYPKSASTTLQEQFFKKLQGHYYLGVGMDKSPENNNQLVFENFRNLFIRLFKTDALNYDPSEAMTYWLNVKKHVPPETPIIISHEKALGSIFSISDPFEKARRIRNIFGDIKILMIIRNQHNIALSQYRDWPYQPNHHFSGKPVSFKEWVDMDIKNDSSFIKTLEYEKVIKFYHSLFTPKNIHVIPIELLKFDKELFTKKLSAAMSIEYIVSEYLVNDFKALNQGATSHQIKLKQIKRKYKSLKNINKYIPEKLKEHIKSFPFSSKSISSKEDEIFFRNYFMDSNTKLSNMLNIDLSKLGY